MVTVAYDSYEHKAKAYFDQTLPAIFRAAFEPTYESQKALDRWMREEVTASRKSFQLRELHEAARAGKYVAENLPQDEIRTMLQTLRMGGDCEDYAAVLLAGCRLMGVKAKLVTSGDSQDNFLHVFVTANGYILDPKGSQAGADFNKRSENNPVVRVWDWNGSLIGGDLV